MRYINRLLLTYFYYSYLLRFAATLNVCERMCEAGNRELRTEWRSRTGSHGHVGDVVGTTHDVQWST